MANQIIKRDENRVTVLAGITDDGNQEIRNLLIDPATGRLKVSAVVSASLATLSDVNISSPVNGQVLSYDSATSKWINSSAGAGDTIGASASTDGEVVLFSGTGGKNLKRSNTISGIAKLTSGVLSAGTAYTDYLPGSPEYIRFNTSPTITPTVGQLYWDANEGTLAVNLDVTNGVTQQIGTELFLRCINKTGSTITDGTTVYVSGAQGNRPTIVAARADALTTSMLLGVVTQNIANNAEGFVTINGDVHGYNTSSFTAGDILYLSATSAGTLTNSAPATPYNVVPVAIALNSTANGTISVRQSRPLAASSVLTDNSDLIAPTQKAVKSYADTKKYYHGVVSRATTSPLPTNITTTTFTLAANTTPISYYYQGTLVTVSSAKTTTLSGAAGLYYIYFDAATGNILNSTVFPGIGYTANVILAIVMWNGSDYGLVSDERHSYTRCTDWHEWAHDTVGVRYESGLTLTHNSGTGNAATFATTAGAIHDEDIDFSIGASSSFPTANAGRLLYQTGATTFTFVNATATTPGYLGANQRPNVVNSTGYVLTQVPSATNRYVNVFVYATTDNHTPIYFFTETVTNTIAGQGGYTSLANARAIPFPNLSGKGLSPELKPIYRLIWRADGVLQAIDTTQDDYRLVTSLPQAAGSVSTTASAVSFNPSGNIIATTVQTAIEELDVEKALLAGDVAQSFGALNIELGNASDTTIARVSAGVASIEGNNIVVNTSSPTLGTITTTGNIELGNASDTTLSRSAAGELSVEGVKVVTETSTNTLTNKTLGTTQLGEVSLKLDAALSADGTWSGITETGTAGATLAFGDLCYFQASDSRWELADANLSAGYDKKLGMCVLAAASDGSATEMLLVGKIRADAAFPTMTIGSVLYMSETAGDIVVTQPSTADVCIRVVGYGNTADELYFNPSPDYIVHT